MRIIREAVLDLMTSAFAALLLFLAVQEMVRRPGADTAMLGGLVPVTARKLPWLAVIAAVLLALWLGARAIGGQRGTLWGAWRWLVRLGLWWSVAALLVFIGVAANGAFTRDISDLNWRFALGYLAAVVPIVLACAIAWQRTAPSGAIAAESRSSWSKAQGAWPGCPQTPMPGPKAPEIPMAANNA